MQIRPNAFTIGLIIYFSIALFLVYTEFGIDSSISQDMENKIISMYAKGMSTSDIEDHIRDIYGLEISDTTISRITDKVLPVAKEWQQRPLESVYAVVFLDAIHYHVRSEGQIIKKAVYIIMKV